MTFFIIIVDDYIIKQLYHSLSSYMADSWLGASHFVGYQLIYCTSRARDIIVNGRSHGYQQTTHLRLELQVYT